MTQFSQKSLDFIQRASRQKREDWLDRNRPEYEKLLVEPLRELMTRMEKSFRKDALGYRFPTRSLARLKRSADRAKAQGWYKDWLGAMVTRDSGSRYEDLPNLYFHLSFDDVFSAGGLYMPSARQTKQIRAWIDQDPSLLFSLLQDREFKGRFKDLGDERVLKTKPRNYSADHPRIEFLRMTGWYVWRPIPKRVLFSSHLADHLEADWRQVLRLNQVLDHYTQHWPTERASEADDIRAPQVNWDE